MFAALLAGWSFTDIAIAVVVVAAVVGIVYAALQQFGVTIPAFVAKVFWIVVCAVLCVVAIKFVAGL